jgi:hypothetical protein
MNAGWPRRITCRRTSSSRTSPMLADDYRRATKKGVLALSFEHTVRS